MVKNLPQDEFAEKTVLGVCLLDSHQAVDILIELSEDDFFVDNRKNRLVFKAMKTLYQNGKSIDLTTVNSQLTNTKDIERVGGLDYLIELSNCVVTLGNTQYYVDLLKEKTLLRQFLVQLGDIEKDYESKEISDINVFIQECESKLNKITQNRRVGEFEEIKTAARKVGEKIRTSHNVEDSITGISTGFEKIDWMINGFSPGELIILAARTSVGKSAFALNIAFNAAVHEKRPVAIFSLEMSTEMIVKRLFSARTSIPSDAIQRGILSKEQRLKLKEAENDFANVPLFIDSNSGNSIDDICMKARKLKDKQGSLALIVVDYIGLINDPKNIFRDNEQAKISMFSRTLKVLAGELNCPILCLAQLNRQTDARDDKRPQIIDLRSSGAIEQDADKIMFIYRPGYYESQGITIGKKKQSFGNQNQESNSQEDEKPQERKTDVVEIIVAKNRSGRVGTVELFFMREYGKFFTPSKADEYAIKKYQSKDVSFEDIIGDEE